MDGIGIVESRANLRSSVSMQRVDSKVNCFSLFQFHYSYIAIHRIYTNVTILIVQQSVPLLVFEQ